MKYLTARPPIDNPNFWIPVAIPIYTNNSPAFACGNNPVTGWQNETVAS